jgi:hypothetical protein
VPVWEVAQWISAISHVSKGARHGAPGFGVYLETHRLRFSHSTAAVLGFSKDGRTIPLVSDKRPWP